MTLLSRVTPTSSSSMSAPARTERRNAYSVLDGNSSSPPWCAMFSTRCFSQGFCAPAPAGMSASAARASSDDNRTVRTGGATISERPGDVSDPRSRSPRLERDDEGERGDGGAEHLERRPQSQRRYEDAGQHRGQRQRPVGNDVER